MLLRALDALEREGIRPTSNVRVILDGEEAAGLMPDLAFAPPDSVGRSLQEALQYPSLNIRGMGSAWVGGDTCGRSFPTQR